MPQILAQTGRSCARRSNPGARGGARLGCLTLGALAGLLILFGGAVRASAAEDRAFLVLALDEDEWVNHDRHYSFGGRLSYLAPEADMPEWARAIAGRVPSFAPHGRQRFSLSLGQSMFTPKHITARELQRDDRPFAGWLYGSAGLVNETADRLDSVEITLGIVGPASFAEEAQEFVHDVFDAPEPRGWDNQLDNEPGLILSADRQWRLVAEVSDGLQGGVSPYLSASLGNVFTYGAAGAAVRFGDGLRADFGPPMIRPGAPGSLLFDAGDDVAWYVFAGAEGRLVARDIFLDGNSFEDSHEVAKKELVGDLSLGAALLLSDRFRLSYTHVFRSKEFDAQEEADQFGALIFTLSF